MNKTDKNFRVAESCASCKYFKSLRASSGGKRKNGYCTLEATGEIPDATLIWAMVEQYWVTPFSFEEYLVLLGRQYSWMTEEQKKREYNYLVSLVAYWKENRNRIHTTNQGNLCDEYVKGGRASNASSHLKREGIAWILQLDDKIK